MSLQLNNVAHELQTISTSIQRVQMPTASIVQTVPTAQHATATPNFTTPFTSAVSTNTVNEMPTTPDLPEETMETENIDIPDLSEATENIDIPEVPAAQEKEFAPTFTVVENKEPAPMKEYPVEEVAILDIDLKIATSFYVYAKRLPRHTT